MSEYGSERAEWLADQQIKGKKYRYVDLHHCGMYYLPCADAFFTYLVHELPRKPVQESPDWGKSLILEFLPPMEVHLRSGGWNLKSPQEEWLFWPMDIFYKKGLDSISHVNLAPDIDLPVLHIHGSRDQ